MSRQADKKKTKGLLEKVNTQTVRIAPIKSGSKIAHLSVRGDFNIYFFNIRTQCTVREQKL